MGNTSTCNKHLEPC